MYPIEPRAVLRLGVLCVVGLLLALGVRSCPTAARNDPSRDVLAVALARRMHANALALDSARGELALAQQAARRVVTRYQELRDTFNIHDTLQVIVFRDRADSVKRSCVDLDNACARFRVKADSSIADLTLDRDRWKRATESLQPSRWDAVKTWAIRIGIGVGAFKLGQSVR